MTAFLLLCVVSAHRLLPKQLGNCDALCILTLFCRNQDELVLWISWGARVHLV